MRGAIFDMDGVLFDTERMHQRCWRELAKKLCVDLSVDFAERVCGTSNDDTIRLVTEYFHTDNAAVILEEEKRMMRERLKENVPVKEGVFDLLLLLRDLDFSLAVASSSPADMIGGNLRATDTILFFDEIVSGDEVAHGKPAPDIFQLAARKIGLAPEECYVFEDSPNGLKAALTAGCAAFWIRDLVTVPEEIASQCVCLHSLLDARDYIAASEGAFL